MRATPPWTLHPLDAGACRVLDADERHVGTLKWIRGHWKFKAIGYEADGSVVPGGGPLTDRHNTRFDSLDEAAIAAGLAPADPTCGGGPQQGIDFRCEGTHQDRRGAPGLDSG